ncbi:pyridoxamine 5'-phosphate oxidase family protein [Pusillimonas sp. ANT_WB101]|uniref:pyridoxamine 5'-phosphate oxidase family protein n=1 Tax=Pusillimonas sp. ANT_WB101 TaxID=2597356 RepID=UPI0011EBCD17|nr:pyridoxamine 5'-phosphate oxidase family protein [Pusillimonas sp. ANT_WB101]KAA0910391.1 general stress protein [Pusillimonas sp. ANT_WB101]
MTNNQQPAHQQLNELISDIRFAMFTTVNSQGVLTSRPMTVQKDPDDEKENAQAATHLWFFMSRTSETVAEFSLSPSVNVSFADTGDDIYVSVSGHARLVEDMALKQRLWSKMNEAWFPQGVTDPDLALVRVEIEQAEFWNVKESKLVQLFKIAKAAFSDEPPTLGTHGRLTP